MAEKSGPSITVRLMGKAAEFLASSPTGGRQFQDLVVNLPGHIRETTPAEIIKLVADQNPLLRDQMIRADGVPRSSTRILLNGNPPRSLSQPLEVKSDPKTDEVIIVIFGHVGPIEIIIVVVLPCDG